MRKERSLMPPSPLHAYSSQSQREEGVTVRFSYSFRWFWTCVLKGSVLWIPLQHIFPQHLNFSLKLFSHSLHTFCPFVCVCVYHTTNVFQERSSPLSLQLKDCHVLPLCMMACFSPRLFSVASTQLPSVLWDLATVRATAYNLHRSVSLAPCEWRKY